MLRRCPSGNEFILALSNCEIVHKFAFNVNYGKAKT